MIVRGELFDFNSLPLNSRMRISFEDMNILNGEDYLRSLEMYKLYSSEDLVDRINDILEISSFIEIVPSIESVSKHENVEREFNVLVREKDYGAIDVYMNMFNDLPEYRLEVALGVSAELIHIHRVTPLNWLRLINRFSDHMYDKLILFRKIMLDAMESHAEDVSFDHIKVRDDSGKFYTDAIIRFKIMGKHVPYDGIVLSPNLQSDMLKEVVVRLCPNSSIDMDMPEGVRASIADTFGDGSLSLRFTAKPVVCGHSCTVRLQNMKTVSLRIEELGFPPEQQLILKRLSTKTTGLTLVTGAKGSGKNTTVFAVANDMVKNTDLKIQDFSAPVEVYMPFTQVDYQNNVQTLLHLCSLSKKEATEVILLNEIPDKSVAFAVQDLVNSSTHVITTTHIDRIWHFPFKLYELYGEDYRNIISQLNAVINQKMFYKQCKHCATRTVISGTEDIILEEFMTERGYDFHYRNTGCPHCDNGVDKNGVQPYTEILVLKPSIKAALQKCEKPYHMEEFIKNYMMKHELSFETSLPKAVDAGDLRIEDLSSIV